MKPIYQIDLSILNQSPGSSRAENKALLKSIMEISENVTSFIGTIGFGKKFILVFIHFHPMDNPTDKSGQTGKGSEYGNPGKKG